MTDLLPQRKDGTRITPWDNDWTNNVRRGIYEAQWGIAQRGQPEADEAKPIKIVPEPVKTGEKLDPGFVLMFVKGRNNG